mmetsp:Transcript_13812/g.33150  ORF Transcript_13812/g.33150 Transcript_13812/m.33150 type:complete len:371 (-) Transcript_13812:548-1660(-)
MIAIRNKLTCPMYLHCLAALLFRLRGTIVLLLGLASIPSSSSSFLKHVHLLSHLVRRHAPCFATKMTPCREFFFLFQNFFHFVPGQEAEGPDQTIFGAIAFQLRFDLLQRLHIKAVQNDFGHFQGGDTLEQQIGGDLIVAVVVVLLTCRRRRRCSITITVTIATTLIVALHQNGQILFHPCHHVGRHSGKLFDQVPSRRSAQNASHHCGGRQGAGSLFGFGQINANVSINVTVSNGGNAIVGSGPVGMILDNLHHALPDGVGQWQVVAEHGGADVSSQISLATGNAHNASEWSVRVHGNLNDLLVGKTIGHEEGANEGSSQGVGGHLVQTVLNHQIIDQVSDRASGDFDTSIGRNGTKDLITAIALIFVL